MSECDAGLGHVQLEVRDLERAVAFYRRFLGLEVSERMESRKGRVVLLSGGDRHREVVLRAVSPGEWSRADAAAGSEDAGASPGGEGGAEAAAAALNGAGPGRHGSALSAPFQIGFQVPDRRALADLFFELRKEGIPTTAVDHGVSWSVYFRDPDGNALEVYWDTRAEQRGRARWEGRSTLLSVDRMLSEERVRELTERAERAAEEAEAADGAGEAVGDEGDVTSEAEPLDADPGEEHPATSD